MIIENDLTYEIMSNIVDTLTIVSICGAADLGKSYISNTLISSLTQQKLITNHLTLDSYLMDRTMRKEKGISGYEVEAYSIMEATIDLIKLKSGQSIEYRPYNHKIGSSNNELVKKIDSTSDIVIFDGLHVMHPSFIPYIDISILYIPRTSNLKK